MCSDRPHSSTSERRGSRKPSRSSSLGTGTSAVEAVRFRGVVVFGLVAVRVFDPGAGEAIGDKS